MTTTSQNLSFPRAVLGVAVTISTLMMASGDYHVTEGSAWDGEDETNVAGLSTKYACSGQECLEGSGVKITERYPFPSEDVHRPDNCQTYHVIEPYSQAAAGIRCVDGVPDNPSLIKHSKSKLALVFGILWNSYEGSGHIQGACLKHEYLTDGHRICIAYRPNIRHEKFPGEISPQDLSIASYSPVTDDNTQLGDVTSRRRLHDDVKLVLRYDNLATHRATGSKLLLMPNSRLFLQLITAGGPKTLTVTFNTMKTLMQNTFDQSSTLGNGLQIFLGYDGGNQAEIGLAREFGDVLSTDAVVATTAFLNSRLSEMLSGAMSMATATSGVDLASYSNIPARFSVFKDMFESYEFALFYCQNTEFPANPALDIGQLEGSLPVLTFLLTLRGGES